MVRNTANRILLLQLSPLQTHKLPAQAVRADVQSVEDAVVTAATATETTSSLRKNNYISSRFLRRPAVCFIKRLYEEVFIDFSSFGADLCLMCRR